jgi:hypothetical protein
MIDLCISESARLTAKLGLVAKAVPQIYFVADSSNNNHKQYKTVKSNSTVSVRRTCRQIAYFLLGNTLYFVIWNNSVIFL